MLDCMDSLPSEERGGAGTCTLSRGLCALLPRSARRGAMKDAWDGPSSVPKCMERCEPR